MIRERSASGSKIDRDMPEIRFFAAADRAIRHENESAERSDLPHELIAVDPRIDALLERQIHSRRAHFDVEKESSWNRAELSGETYS